MEVVSERTAARHVGQKLCSWGVTGLESGGEWV